MDGSPGPRPKQVSVHPCVPLSGLSTDFEPVTTGSPERTIDLPKGAGIKLTD